MSWAAALIVLSFHAAIQNIDFTSYYPEEASKPLYGEPQNTNRTDTPQVHETILRQRINRWDLEFGLNDVIATADFAETWSRALASDDLLDPTVLSEVREVDRRGHGRVRIGCNADGPYLYVSSRSQFPLLTISQGPVEIKAWHNGRRIVAHGQATHSGFLQSAIFSYGMTREFLAELLSEALEHEMLFLRSNDGLLSTNIAIGENGREALAAVARVCTR